MSEGVLVVRVSRGNHSRVQSLWQAALSDWRRLSYLALSKRANKHFFFFSLSTVELFLQGGESIKTPEERLITEFQAS